MCTVLLPPGVNQTAVKNKLITIIIIIIINHTHRKILQQPERLMCGSPTQFLQKTPSNFTHPAISILLYSYASVMTYRFCMRKEF
jgi:hypothetical protein